jgi:hypothetical protein
MLWGWELKATLMRDWIYARVEKLYPKVEFNPNETLNLYQS